MTPDAIRLMIRFTDPDRSGTGAETTWAKAVEGGWVIDHPLWYSRSVNYGDVVRAVRRDNEFVVAALVERGGWTTGRTSFPDATAAEVALRRLRFDHNAVVEPYGHGKWAVSVPTAAVPAAVAVIERGGGTVEWTVGPDTPTDTLDFTPTD